MKLVRFSKGIVSINRIKRIESALESLVADIDAMDAVEVFGRVKTVQGLLVEVIGPVRELRVGGRVAIETRLGNNLMCEIAGFENDHALCLPFGPLEGVRLGCKAIFFIRMAALRSHLMIGSVG